MRFDPGGGPAVAQAVREIGNVDHISQRPTGMLCTV
jgi:hypothetical protein